MTLKYIRPAGVIVLSVGLVSVLPSHLLAQAGAAAAAAAKAAAQTAAPTGPMSALSKAATAIRTSRAAAAASRGAAAGSQAGARATAVSGYLWTANNSPISNVTVQLRNTVNGQVEMLTKTNQVGEFLFQDMKGGSYVIEYVDSASQTAATSAATNAGGVIAVGSPFTVAPGETVATFVRSLNNVPIFIPDLASNVATQAVQDRKSTRLNSSHRT